MRPLRVALYSGVILEGDAISNSLMLKLDLIERLARRGWDISVRAFCLGSDIEDPNIRAIPKAPAGLLAEAGFRRADVHVFEVSMDYSLFDALAVIDPGKVTAAVYHNVTPVELVSDEANLRSIGRAGDRAENLAGLDHVFCVSETNRQDLRRLVDIPEAMTSLLPLPPHTSRPSPARSARPAERPVEFLFVGRPVRAKGLLDLLEACRLLLGRGVTHFRLRILGRLSFAEPDVVTALRTTAQEHPEVIRAEFDLGNDALSEALEAADALVMPSLHEGYCVPVVEALGSQCHVISYDNSNLPSVGHGLTQLVPTGDPGALADAMERFVVDLTAARTEASPFSVPTSQGPIPEAEWRRRAARLALDLAAGYDVAFAEFLLEAAELVEARANPPTAGPENRRPGAP